MLSRVHPVIRRPLYVFSAVVLMSAAAVMLSDTYMEDAYSDQQSERRAMRIWKNKIDGSRESNKIIDEYESSYTRLVNRHIVGEENRLSWFETIQATTNARGMPSVKYNITSQQLVDDVTGSHTAQGLKVYKSKMTLDIKMAHEGDLFAMLNNLDDKAKGLFVVNNCNIERTIKEAKDLRENMKASCEINWFTFNATPMKEEI